MTQNHFNIQGLTDVEVIESRKTNGTNSLKLKENNAFFDFLKNVEETLTPLQFNNFYINFDIL